MPNKQRLDKRKTSSTGPDSRLRRTTSAQSAKELLRRTTPALTLLAEQATRQTYWRNWLKEHLPAELECRIASVVEREGALTILAASAAWSARLRYAVAELEPRIRAAAPAISTVKVRVLPRG